MHPQTVKKVLADEETLDVAKTAEAVMEDKRRRDKKDKPKTHENSARAYVAWLAREREEDEFRKKVAKVWNKRKKV